MPAQLFKFDLSQPGTGISIVPSDPATQQVVKEGILAGRSDKPDMTLLVSQLRHGETIIETIEVNTGNGIETYHIMTKPKSH